MTITSKSELVFSADDDSVMQSLKRQTAGNDALEKSYKSVADTAAKGQQLLQELVEKSLAANKDLASEIDKLKKKLHEQGEETKGIGHAFESVKGSFEQLKGAIAGSEIISFLNEWTEAQNKVNEQVVRTQVEYDKVARKLQVQSLMKDEEFQKLFKRDIAPMALANKVSLESVTEAYTVARSQGVEDKNLKGVVEQSIQGAMASGVGQEGIGDFTKAMITKLQQSGTKPEDINETNIHGAVVPTVNVAGKLRMSGSDVLGTQQRMSSSAAFEGLSQEQVLSEMVTLTQKGGMSKERASQQVEKIAGHLANLKEDAQKKLGPELSAAISQQMAKGNLMGAISQLNSSLDEQMKSGKLNEEGKGDIIATMFGRREMTGGRILLREQAFAQQTMEGLHDEERLKKALPIATGGAERAEQNVKTQQQIAELDQGKLAEKNENVIGLVKAELMKEGFSGYRMGITEKILKARAGAGMDVLKSLEDEDKTNKSFMNVGNTLGVLDARPMGAASDFTSRIKERLEMTEKETDSKEIANAPKLAAPSIAAKSIPGAFQEPELDKAKRLLAEAELKHATMKAELESHHKITGKGQIHLSATEKKALKADDLHIEELKRQTQLLEILVKKATVDRGRQSGG